MRKDEIIQLTAYMPLTTIFPAPCLSVDYDSHLNCLSLNLLDQPDTLTLQDIAQKITGVPLEYLAWCMVQDNLASTGRSAELEAWFLDQLLPAFHQAGVKYWTWVCSPALRSHYLVEQAAKRLPQVALTVFNDLEHAITWLQRFR